MHYSKKLFLSLLILTSTSVFAAEKCLSGEEVPSQQQVKALFDEWNTALQTKNPDKVTAEYAKNAVLLPTLSNTPRTNHAEIRAYFVDFLKKNPVATIDKQVMTGGCNWASDTGIYTFQLTDPEKGRASTQARFSFVYERIDGQWMIVSHHSSLMPETEENN